MPSRIIDINRDRAMQSYLNIEAFKKSETKENQQKMKSYCRKIPNMIRVHGLLETLVYLKSKSNDKDGAKTLYFVIKTWIEDSIIKTFNIELGREDIIYKLVEADVKSYRNYTEEALSIAIWYKRHSESLFQEEMEE